MLHIHACCKHMFQVFSGVLYVCLQVFHLDVAYVCNDFQIFFKYFRKCFRRLF
jgi:succinate dehydrogenase hydrophobic anchor subunit